MQCCVQLFINSSDARASLHQRGDDRQVAECSCPVQGCAIQLQDNTSKYGTIGMMKLLVVGYCDNSVREKDWRCRKCGM
jgi:hypothetical protein